MRLRSLVVRASTALLVCGGCIAPPPPPLHPALRVAADDVQRVTTICVDPVAIGFRLEAHEQRLATIASALRSALIHKGYRSPEIEDTRKAAQALADGGTAGFFDPDTGFLDAEGLRGQRAHRLRGLQTRLGCGALLVADVVPVYATFRLGRAEWDGVRQYMVANPEESGWLRALSLHVRLFDVTGRELYFSTGGIEVLVKISGVFLRKGQPVEATAVLGDEARIREGAWASLAELPSREEPPDTDTRLPAARPDA